MSELPSQTPKVPTLRDYARAARRAALGVPGVARVGSGWSWLWLAVPGVQVQREERDRLYVELSVTAAYGENLPVLGAAIQVAVREALRAMPALRPVAIDIIFTGMRPGKRAQPKR